MIWVGIDPDLNGGISTIDWDRRMILQLAALPVLKGGPPLNQPDRFDVDKVWQLLTMAKRHKATVVALEQPAFSPGKQRGVTRKFENFGTIRGLCELAFTPSRVILTSPSAWKKALGLSTDKGESRALATKLFPSHEQVFRLVKNHGLAEACLLSHYTSDAYLE